MPTASFPKPQVTIPASADAFRVLNQVWDALDRAGMPDEVIDRFLGRALEEMQSTDARVGCTTAVLRAASEFAVLSDEGDSAELAGASAVRSRQKRPAAAQR